VDYIDESEVLTPADETYHVDKHPFKVPFVCGCRNLGEALRRISEGAAMSRFLSKINKMTSTSLTYRLFQSAPKVKLAPATL
jgi:pyridoxal biosynthesis lyase PdxS